MAAKIQKLSYQLNKAYKVSNLKFYACFFCFLVSKMPSKK